MQKKKKKKKGHLNWISKEKTTSCEKYSQNGMSGLNSTTNRGTWVVFCESCSSVGTFAHLDTHMFFESQILSDELLIWYNSSPAISRYGSSNIQPTVTQIYQINLPTNDTSAHKTAVWQTHMCYSLLVIRRSGPLMMGSFREAILFVVLPSFFQLSCFSHSCISFY